MGTLGAGAISQVVLTLVAAALNSFFFYGLRTFFEGARREGGGLFQTVNFLRGRGDGGAFFFS